MRGPACNMPAAERERLAGRFAYPSLEELIEAKRAFPRYIFYDTWGRRRFREVFCPECGRFDIEKERAYDVYTDNFFDFHHGDQTCCPQCGAEGMLICLGKMRNMNSLAQTRKALILRGGDEALTAMAGTFTMEYAFNDLDPYPMWYPTKRYAFGSGTRMKWTREERGRFEKGRWVCEGEVWQENRTVTEPFPDGYNMGGGFLDGSYDVIGAWEIQRSPLRYSQLVEAFFSIAGVDLTMTEGEAVRGVIPYLAEYTRRPQMEMLVKLEHTDVIEDLLRGETHASVLDWKAKTPAAFFGLGKTEYRAFRACGGKAADLEAWRRTMPGSPFAEWKRLHGVFGANLPLFLNMFGQDPRREKIVRWYAEQETHCEEIWAVWQDLLNLERELGNDVTHDDVLMPADVRRRHDEAAELRSAIRKRETKRDYGKRIYPALKKRYAYSDGTLSVVVPVCAEEIENEGAALRHCVAGYAERHVKGIKTILFLRWSDDIGTPYVTVEMNGSTVVQIHGYRNERNIGQCRPEAIHAIFLDEWLRWLRQGSPRMQNGKPVRAIIDTETEVKTA